MTHKSLPGLILILSGMIWLLILWWLLAERPQPEPPTRSGRVVGRIASQAWARKGA